MDTGKLRQKILDLAIHGKLVPQDPNDEPASELLKRIHAERERLVKAGKLKKDKNNTSDKSHYEKVPFEIPKSWVWCSFKDIGIVYSGGTPSTLIKAYWEDGEIPWITPADLTGYTNIFISRGKKNITYIGYEKSSAQLVPSHSILLSSRAPVGYVVINKNQLCTNQGFKSLSPLIPGLELYIYYFCLYNIEDFILRASGTTFKELSKEEFSKTLIPLPPVNEQNIIVKVLQNILQKINSINVEEKKLLALIKQFKSTTLNYAVGGDLVAQDPKDQPAIELLKKINPNFKPCDNSHYKKIPKGWSIVPLAEILDYEQPKPYIVDSENYSQDYSVPVLTAGKKYILGYTNEEYGICTKLPVILFDDFTTDSRYIDFPFKVKSSAVKILHAKQGINAIYVGYFMNITNLVSKTHKRYWISEYSKICMPLPPRKEQNQIVNIVKMFFSQLDKLMQYAAN